MEEEKKEINEEVKEDEVVRGVEIIPEEELTKEDKKDEEVGA